MTTKPQTDIGPSAFLCYARFDDEHDGGALSELRKRLSGEVRAQTGAAFPIFQDRDGTKWGDNWRDRIKLSLNEVTFLICVLTPSFFASDECKREVQVFLEREAARGRSDLILPLYYIRCPTLEDDSRLEEDAVSTELAKRQRVDWRDLRHKPITSESVLATIDETAGKLIQALNRVTLQSSAESGTPSDAFGAARTGSHLAAGERPERTTLTVDPTDADAHATIADAIEAANHGGRILVHPGLYEEPLVIEKVLEILGQGDTDRIIVRVSGAAALTARTGLCRVAHLTLRQTGGGQWFSVHIAEGRLDLEGCDISSESLACVAIEGDTDPRLVGNRIHDGKEGGVFVFNGGRATLEDNDIFGNAFPGIEIKEGANATVRRNRIHDGKQSGVLVGADGLGNIVDNDIVANGFSGIEIKEGADPTVRKNRIHDGKQSGIYVHANGRGTLDDNDIVGNAYAGISVKGGKATVRNNRVNKNGYQAIWIYDGGGGTFTENDLRDNKLGAWDIREDSIKNVTRSGNIEDDEDDHGA